jgi:hypothetical protein
MNFDVLSTDSFQIASDSSISFRTYLCRKIENEKRRERLITLTLIYRDPLMVQLLFCSLLHGLLHLCRCDHGNSEVVISPTRTNINLLLQSPS